MTAIAFGTSKADRAHLPTLNAEVPQILAEVIADGVYLPTVSPQTPDKLLEVAPERTIADECWYLPLLLVIFFKTVGSPYLPIDAEGTRGRCDEGIAIALARRVLADRIWHPAQHRHPGENALYRIEDVFPVLSLFVAFGSLCWGLGT